MTTLRSIRRPFSILTAAALALGAVALAAAPATAEPDDGFDIPVQAFRDGGGWILTTWVSVNGSDPIRVALDTGTSVLVLNPGAIRNAPTSVTDIPADIVYDGTGVNGYVAEGFVSVATGSIAEGGEIVATTPTEVGYVQGDQCVEPGGCPHWGGVIDGVWGIGPNVMAFPTSTPGEPYRMFSPATQFGGASADGLTIDYTSDDPAVRLGPVQPGPGDVTVPRAAGPVTMPDGRPQWRDPELCWTISAGPNVGSGCRVTRIDSGQAIGEVSGRQYDGVVTPENAPPENGSGKRKVGMVVAGALVSWAVVGAPHPFAGVIADSTYPNFWGQYELESGSPEENENTGQNFYRLHVVRYDNVSGATYISPTPGVPLTPQLTAATASAGDLAVQWVPGEPGAEPVQSWAVTVVDAAGVVVHRAMVEAASTSTTVAGLAPDTAYTVSVAGVNARGLGASSETRTAEFASAVPEPGATPAALAATGAEAAPWWPGALALLAGAVVLVVRRRRPRRSLRVSGGAAADDRPTTAVPRPR
jgi:hypothetical protein